MKRFHKLAAFVLAAVMVLGLTAPGLEAHAADPTLDVVFDGFRDYSKANEVLTLMNAKRAAQGLAPLSANPALMEYAMQRAAETYLYYSHTRPDGSDCFTILDDSFSSGTAAENIAIGQSTAQDVMDDWMNSAGHRANIMDSSLTSVGIGCFYQADGTTTWVQLFHSNAPSGSYSTTGITPVSNVTVSAKASNLAGHMAHHTFSNAFCAAYLYAGSTVGTDFYLVNTQVNWCHIQVKTEDYGYTSSNSSVFTVNNSDHTITAVNPGVAQLGIRFMGTDIKAVDDAGYLVDTTTVEVLETPALTYEKDSAGNIHINYSQFNSGVTLYYKGNHDELWTMGNREADGIYTHYSPDPTDTYVYVMRYYDNALGDFVEVGERLIIALGSEQPNPDPEPSPNPDPEPSPDPDPDKPGIPNWDTEPTLDQVNEIIEKLKVAYPNGSDWPVTNYYEWLAGSYTANGTVHDGSDYGDFALVATLSDHIFGDLPAKVIYDVTVDDLRPGDILLSKLGILSMVTDVAPDYIRVVSTNGESVIWGYLYPDEILTEDIVYGITRYTSAAPGVEAITPSIVPSGLPWLASGDESRSIYGLYSSIIKWTLYMDGTLYIYGYGDLDNTTMHLEWQDYADQVKCIVIGPNIFEIGRQNFKSFKNLEKVILGEDVQIIHDNAFQYCSALKSVNFPSSLTEICKNAFDGAALEELTLPDTITTLGEYAFSDNTKLTKLSLPASITDMGRSAFADCTSLTEINFAEGFSYLGDQAFYGADSLTTITLPGTLTEIPEMAFASSGLQTVYLSAGTQVIGEYAFYLCYDITALHLPNTLTTVGDCAFDHCEDIRDVYFYGSYEEWNNVEIGTNNTFMASFAMYHFLDPNQCYHRNVSTLPAKAATCTEDGLTEGSACADCGEVLTRQNTIPATGHEWGNWYPIQMPTETTPGKENHQCMNCELIETREVPPLEHTHNYTSAVTDPTCTEQGYTTYTCRCGDSYVSDYVEAAGHRWGGWETVKAATQTQTGEEKRECSVCRKVEVRVTPVLPAITFTDVPEGAWFSAAVNWAVSNNVTSGTGNGTFSPDMACSRSQVVTFLWRAAGSPEPSGENPFSDVTEGAWYYKAVLWAVENGITSGTTPTTFAPDMPCSRSQVVTFLYRAEGAPAVSGENPFSDVSKAAWYYNAVLWAVENSITSGTTPTTFAPDMTCSRSQVVTFLYRAED